MSDSSQNGTNGHGTNGRGTDGRFLPGNPGGPGNPHVKRVNKLRTALFAAVTEEDVKDITEKLVAAAKAGDTVAAREVLDRTIGKAVATDLLQRIEELEQRLSETMENIQSRGLNLN